MPELIELAMNAVPLALFPAIAVDTIAPLAPPALLAGVRALLPAWSK